MLWGKKNGGTGVGKHLVLGGTGKKNHLSGFKRRGGGKLRGNGVGTFTGTNMWGGGGQGRCKKEELGGGSVCGWSVGNCKTRRRGEGRGGGFVCQRQRWRVNPKRGKGIKKRKYNGGIWPKGDKKISRPALKRGKTVGEKRKMGP